MNGDRALEVFGVPRLLEEGSESERGKRPSVCRQNL